MPDRNQEAGASSGTQEGAASERDEEKAKAKRPLNG